MQVGVAEDGKTWPGVELCMIAEGLPGSSGTKRPPEAPYSE